MLEHRVRPGLQLKAAFVTSLQSTALVGVTRVTSPKAARNGGTP
jgi:hypothetical protein